MKLILYITFIFFCFNVSSQEWRDSLDVARAAYKKKDYAKAMKYYESAQKKAPDNVDLSDEMAQSSYKAREFEKAEKIYQQSSSSKETNVQKADNYHNLGNARMKRKDYEGAIEAYKESLRMNPNDDKTRYNLSEAIRQLKNKQEQEKKDNQKDQQNDNKDQKDKEGDKGKDGDQKDSNDQQGNKGKPKDQPGDGKPSDQKEGQLPNKTVDRMLDKLMKDEAETKRKMSGSNGESKSSNSGKDW